MALRDRREFLGASAAASAIAWGAASAKAADQPVLKAGVVGLGGYGNVDTKAALKVGGVEIAGVCDVHKEHLQKSADEIEKLQGKRPKTFKLYDDLLAEDALDLMIIGSPPHWHTLQLISAVERGLDVYCEKPLTYDVREGRAIVDAVGKSDRIVQVGFQRRQSEAYRQATEFIKGGGIGKLVQVDAQIHFRAGLKDPTPQDPPESLDWNLWCGPGPLIPYSPQVGHRSWRLERTSGHGHLVDWGIHHMDAIRYYLGLAMPKRIAASGGIYYHKGRITTPDTLSVHFDFDGLPVHWRHRLWGATEYAPEVNNGIFFFGDEGTVFSSDRHWVYIPKNTNAEREEHAVASDMGTKQMADFLDAVRKRRQPCCPVLEGFRSTATVQLAMISHETNSVVQWDEANEQIVDNPAAAKLLKREYREPWEHPYQG